MINIPLRTVYRFYSENWSRQQNLISGQYWDGSLLIYRCNSAVSPEDHPLLLDASYNMHGVLLTYFNADNHGYNKSWLYYILENIDYWISFFEKLLLNSPFIN